MNTQNPLEKLDSKNLEISPQAVKAANIMPSKEKSGKTMFKMPEYAFEFVSNLSKIDGIDSIKEALDVISKFAKDSFKSNTMIFYEIPDDSIRKSMTISDSAKNILSNIAKDTNKSRDNILYSALVNLIDKISVKELTINEKIKYAIILKNMAEKMLDIFYSPDAVEAREKLSASNDHDFGDPNNFQSCGDLLTYISQLDELPYKLDEFINIKEKENENI